MLYMLLPLRSSFRYMLSCRPCRVHHAATYAWPLHAYHHEQRTSLKLNTHVTQRVYYTKRDYIWGKIIIIACEMFEKLIL